MNKFSYKNLTPFKWFVLENFPFIEADFDALTEWQLFCKLGKEINKIIDSQNIVGTQMENVTNAFIELQNYVNNYFDNLDVQEEINNKLNEMVANGTLYNIMKPYFTSVDTRIEQIKNQVNSIASGSPLVASSIAEMTDTSRIYVNSSNGHWYWYNGSSWIDGGIFHETQIMQNAWDNPFIFSLKNEKYLKESASFISSKVTRENNILKFSNYTATIFQLRIPTNFNKYLVKYGANINCNIKSLELSSDELRFRIYDETSHTFIKEIPYNEINNLSYTNIQCSIEPQLFNLNHVYSFYLFNKYNSHNVYSNTYEVDDLNITLTANYPINTLDDFLKPMIENIINNGNNYNDVWDNPFIYSLINDNILSQKANIVSNNVQKVDNTLIFKPIEYTIFQIRIPTFFNKYLTKFGCLIDLKLKADSINSEDLKFDVYNETTSTFVNTSDEYLNITNEFTNISCYTKPSAFNLTDTYSIYLRKKSTANSTFSSNDLNIIIGTRKTLNTINDFIVPLINKISNNDLSNYNWNSVGDSITALNRYQPVVKNATNINYINNGLSSSTIAINNTYLQNQSIVERICGLNGNTPMVATDIFTISGGANDCYYNSPLGELVTNHSNYDNTTVYGALQTICEYLQNLQANQKILLFTPTHSNRDDWSASQHPTTMAKIRKAIIDVAEFYSIPVVDLWAECGINTFNIQKENNPTTVDGIHPNELGAEMIAEPIIIKFREIL